jgi:hypothetical protein
MQSSTLRVAIMAKAHRLDHPFMKFLRREIDRARKRMRSERG